MERRPLSSGVNAIPNVDPEAAQNFITQERRPPPKPESADLSVVPERPFRSIGSEPPRRRRSKATGVTPIGLIPVTVRLRPELAGALKRASLERQLAGEEPFSQQDIVEQAIEPWLRSNGYMS
jgi:hypothetical protein